MKSEFQKRFAGSKVAHENDIDIEGACGGECACSTCHVLLEQEAYGKLPPPDDDEASTRLRFWPHLGVLGGI